MKVFFQNSLDHWRRLLERGNIQAMWLYPAQNNSMGVNIVFNMKKMNRRFSSMKLTKEVPVLVSN